VGGGGWHENATRSEISILAIESRGVWGKVTSMSEATADPYVMYPENATTVNTPKPVPVCARSTGTARLSLRTRQARLG
jgi:hypothetical protein